MIPLWNKRLKRYASPPNKRLYAIGDVHGCLDELKILIQRIVEDNSIRLKKSSTIVLLGDLIDRGPNSAGVIDYWMSCDLGDIQKLHLIGNHEEMMMRVLSGEVELFQSWLKHGGDTCLSSYGLSSDALLGHSFDTVLSTLKKRIPQSHLDFLKAGYDRLAFGDYCLVHAGVDPRRAIEAQTAEQFHWMREPFLSWRKPMAVKIIHGHTITEEPDSQHHRIGVDTGAYITGKLTAVRIEDEDVDFINTL